MRRVYRDLRNESKVSREEVGREVWPYIVGGCLTVVGGGVFLLPRRCTGGSIGAGAVSVVAFVIAVVAAVYAAVAVAESAVVAFLL